MLVCQVESPDHSESTENTRNWTRSRFNEPRTSLTSWILTPPLAISWALKSRRLSCDLFDEAFLFQVREEVDHLLMAG